MLHGVRYVMPRINTKEDFWNRVDKTETCWNWTGCKSDKGYGKLYFYGKDWRAHRLSYFWAYGERPLAVCHKCDNPSCVRPEHLFGATNGINNTDRHAKGRSNFLLGESHQNSKLTAEQVRQIRLRYSNGDISCAELAREFGMSGSHVRDIVNRRRWAHLV